MDLDFKKPDIGKYLKNNDGKIFIVGIDFELFRMLSSMARRENITKEEFAVTNIFFSYVPAPERVGRLF